MAEEVAVVKEENQEVQTDKESNQQQEFSDIERKALEMGWRPKDDYEGDEEEFIDAREFVRRKPLFEKIEHQSRELKEVRKALRELQGHHQKIAEVSYRKAMDDLKVQYKKALEDGDADKVTEITEQIADAKAEEKASKVRMAQASAQPHPDFMRWVERNQWYAQDEDLRTRADRIGTSLAMADPQKDPNEILEEVTRRVKELYPNKFENPYRKKPSAVDGGSKGSANKSSNKGDDVELSEEETKVMKRLVRMNVMTEKEYKDDIRKLRG